MIQIDDILQVEQYVQDVDAVVFDLDDTLYSEKQYVKSGYAAIAKLFPQIPDMESKLWEVFLRGGRAIDEVFENEHLLEHKDLALKEYRFHKPNIELYKGVSEMLTRIKTSGKKIGIITDGRPEGQRAKLMSLCIDVDEVIITDELGSIEFRKPNTKAFEIMQERLRIAYDRMIYIGDNTKKDFSAPEKLGMKWIYFCNTDGLYFNKDK